MSRRFTLLDLQQGRCHGLPGPGVRACNNDQEKLTANVQSEAKAMAEEALAPMVADRRIHRGRGPHPRIWRSSHGLGPGATGQDRDQSF